MTVIQHLSSTFVDAVLLIPGHANEWRRSPLLARWPDTASMRTITATLSLVAVLLAAGCTGEADPSPTATPAPTVAATPPSAPPSPAVTPATWGQPVSIDGYTISFTAPADVTDQYIHSDNGGYLMTTVTLTAGKEPLDPRRLKVGAHDGNFSAIPVQVPGEVVIPAGGTRTSDVYLSVDGAQLKKLIVLTIAGSAGVVEWRQDSRP